MTTNLTSRHISRRAYVDVEDGQIHYRTNWDQATSDAPPLVMFHQTASSSAMFESLFPQLGQDRQLIAFDTPGFGLSFRPPTAPSTGDWVRWLTQALDALGLTRAHLLGHHTGAAIACEMAAAQPSRTLSLTMIGGLAMGPSERARWSEGITPIPIRADGSHLMQVWDRVATIDQSPAAYPPSLPLRHRESVDNLLAGERWHEAYMAVFNQDFEAFLEQVRSPILLISGREDVLWDYFEPTARLRPDAEVVVLNAGAYLIDQTPDEVVTPVREFLRTHSD